MQENPKELNEQIISSFKNAVTDILELQDDMLSISEETIDQLSSDVVVKYHCFSTKEASNNFLLLVLTFTQIRPLKTPLYGQLLFKISKYLSPLTSQQELMALFHSNKLIILNLFESNLIIIDTIIKYQRTNHQYIYYFYDEIRKNDPVQFNELMAKNEKFKKFVLSTNYEEHDRKRRAGLNDGEIETLIREDKLSSIIHPNHPVHTSLYENCEFLSKASISEYAAYFGSMNVLEKFLEYKDIKTDKLLIYAISGCQTDVFNFLIDQKKTKIRIRKNCISTAIEFHATKEIEINAYVNENDRNRTRLFIATKNVTPNKNLKKFQSINDLYLSLKNFNWHFFIDNLLYVSDQINDHCDDSDEQFTILHYACYMGYEEVVKLLLSLYDKNGASIDAQQSSIDVNVQDKYKRTPLHLAILNQKVEIVKILFEYNDTNFVLQDVDRKTSFHYAAETKNMEIVRLFFESSRSPDIELNIPDMKRNTALHYFCKPRYFVPSILKYVCEFKQVDLNNVNHKEVTELMNLSKRKKKNRILQVLVNCSRIDLNFQTPTRRETALMIAAKFKNLEAAKVLMNDIDRIDPNIQDFKLRTALHISVFYDSSEVFNFLIRQPNVNVNITDDSGVTPVFMTIQKNHFDFFKSMLKVGNKIDFEYRDAFSQNLLLYSMRFRHSSCLDSLLKIYSINEPDSKGTNAFHHACSIGCVDVIKELINKLGTTTDIDECNDYNSVEIEEKRKMKIARYKPGEKIRINQKDSNGMTPLHYACQCDSVEKVDFLLSVPGIKINEKDNRGETPFFYVCKYNYVEIAKILVKTNQINPCTTNYNGISALSYLSEQDQKNIFLYN